MRQTTEIIKRETKTRRRLDQGARHEPISYLVLKDQQGQTTCIQTIPAAPTLLVGSQQD
jgi:hypothetical protein